MHACWSRKLDQCTILRHFLGLNIFKDYFKSFYVFFVGVSGNQVDVLGYIDYRQPLK